MIYIDSSVKNYTYSPDQLRLLTASGLRAGLAMHSGTAEPLPSGLLLSVKPRLAMHSVKNGAADVVEMGFQANNLVQAAKGGKLSEPILLSCTT